LVFFGRHQVAVSADTKFPWCAAYIGEDEKSSLARRVLKSCPVGRVHAGGMKLVLWPRRSLTGDRGRTAVLY
jgi:hypothetical protein